VADSRPGGLPPGPDAGPPERHAGARGEPPGESDLDPVERATDEGGVSERAADQDGAPEREAEAEPRDGPSRWRIGRSALPQGLRQGLPEGLGQGMPEGLGQGVRKGLRRIASHSLLQRRTPTRPSSPWRFGVPVVLAVAGLLFSVSAETARGTDLRGGENARLVDLIQAAQQRNDQALQEVAALQRDITGISAGLGQDAEVGRAQRAARALESAAGMQALSGRGLSVTLDDAPPGAIDKSYPGLPKPTPDDLVVHQQDLQAVVNALWAGGADAIKLMDQRVISTSAVRCVGNVLILQDRVYSPPYVVTAVGDPSRLRSALAGAKAVADYLGYVEAYGLGWRVEEHARVTIPAYAGSLELQHAEVYRR
jgi:uncharacterized protein YlxW (UPF0749 family)